MKRAALLLTTVTVRNGNDVHHSVTARDDTFCTYHPNMTGQITVA